MSGTLPFSMRDSVDGLISFPSSAETARRPLEARFVRTMADSLPMSSAFFMDLSFSYVFYKRHFVVVVPADLLRLIRFFRNPY